MSECVAEADRVMSRLAVGNHTKTVELDEAEHVSLSAPKEGGKGGHGGRGGGDVAAVVTRLEELDKKKDQDQEMRLEKEWEQMQEREREKERARHRERSEMQNVASALGEAGGNSVRMMI
jgi:hypothetical protein